MSLEIFAETDNAGHYQFILNGEPIKGWLDKEGVKVFFEESNDDLIIEIFRKYFDFLKSISSSFDFYFNGVSLVEDHLVNGVVKLNLSKESIDIGFCFNTLSYESGWYEKWSGLAHLNELKHMIDIEGINIYWEDWPNDDSVVYQLIGSDKFWPYIFFKHDLRDFDIKEALLSCLNYLYDRHEAIKKILRSRFSIANVMLIEEFEFPEEIRVECEQYLIYFSRFLSEIGINAKNAISNNITGKTLFSVMPDHKEQALSQIREALDIYLNLPRNNSINPMNPSMDLASQQLAANIYHLKSQLMLANAIIQQKEMLIEQQGRLINQQGIAGDILLKSLKKHDNQEEDTENLVGELVKIKKAEWEFIELDLPEMLRWLKNKFNKKNQK